MPGRAEQPVFYYDIGSPDCYLAAEQIMHVLPSVAEWRGVLASELDGPAQPIDRAAVERAARELGLQPVRWPDRLPPDSRPAMLAATYARQIGRGVAFSLAAFRQAFAAGRDLADPDTLLIAGAACEMHPAALSQALGRRGVAHTLAQTTSQARERGVRSVPSIEAAGLVFEGLAQLPAAGRALERCRQAIRS